ncbi:MAG: hypothetical protein WKF37_22080 [Bryobacteraceae bacterium]
MNLSKLENKGFNDLLFRRCLTIPEQVAAMLKKLSLRAYPVRRSFRVTYEARNASGECIGQPLIPAG